MSLNAQQILHSLAMSQLMMISPELGDSYAGKSANTMGLLLLAMAGMQDRMLSTAPGMRTRLEGLLGDATLPDGALAAEVAAALADAAGGSWSARQDRLMGALEAVHGWADSHDPALAALCRNFLADLAETELLIIPAMPG